MSLHNDIRITLRQQILLSRKTLKFLFGQSILLTNVTKSDTLLTRSLSLYKSYSGPSWNFNLNFICFSYDFHMIFKYCISLFDTANKRVCCNFYCIAFHFLTPFRTPSLSLYKSHSELLWKFVYKSVIELSA